MKRSGWLSLIIYILYTVVFGGLSLYFSNVIKSFDSEQLGMAATISVIFILIYLVCATLAICGLVAAVLKLLHMATGWLVFGISCILIDAFVLMYMVSSVFPAIYSDIITQGVTETSIIVIIGIIVSFFLSVGALISNIRSLRN